MRSTIAGDMTVLFFFTAILLVSVIFFVYALVVILQQKRYSELQKDFINNMTHELKTPISSIGISAEIVSEPGIVNEPERLVTYGNIIRKENQRLNLLVEKVLQVARFEKGGVMLKKEWLDLNLLLKTMVESYRTGARPGIKLSLTTDDSIGKVEADVIHLTNIIHNLLDNSVKYASENPEIQISTRREGNRVLLIFSDNGPGIEPRYRKRIFRKFFRVPSGNVHDVKGFGLGLYYVKTVCLAHRWQVNLDKKTVKGATFIIQIPVKP
jgi:two-component system phosphate regulon sensor histidine kinase PhoR